MMERPLGAEVTQDRTTTTMRPNSIRGAGVNRLCASRGYDASRMLTIEMTGEASRHGALVVCARWAAGRGAIVD